MPTKRIFLLSLLFWLPLLLCGQGKISVQVYEIDKEREKIPLIAALVVLYEAKSSEPLDSVNADFEGIAEMDNLQAGTYRLEVSFIGFRTYKTGDIVIAGKEQKREEIVLASLDECNCVLPVDVQTHFLVNRLRIKFNNRLIYFRTGLAKIRKGL